MRGRKPKIIVVQTGSGFTRAGFVGKARPMISIPSLIGHAPSSSKLVVGKKCTLDPTLEIRPLFRDQEFPNSDELEAVWRDALAPLGINDCSNCAVLCVLPGFCTRRDVATARAVLADRLGVARYAFRSAEDATVAHLCLAETRSLDGVVVRAGAERMSATPVIEGRPLRHARRATAVGGRMVTRVLLRMMLRAGTNLDTSEHSSVLADDVKARVCRVQPLYMPVANAAWSSRRASHFFLPFSNIPSIREEPSSFEPFELPNGVTVAPERPPAPPFEQFAPEVLFNPRMFGFEDLSLPDLVAAAINAADRGVRGRLWGHIYLVGGGSLLSGFAKRLTRELGKRRPKTLRVELIETPERLNATWLGGAAIAGSDAFEWQTDATFEAWLADSDFD